MLFINYPLSIFTIFFNVPTQRTRLICSKIRIIGKTVFSTVHKWRRIFFWVANNGVHDAATLGANFIINRICGSDVLHFLVREKNFKTCSRFASGTCNLIMKIKTQIGFLFDFYRYILGNSHFNFINKIIV